MENPKEKEVGQEGGRKEVDQRDSICGSSTFLENPKEKEVDQEDGGNEVHQEDGGKRKLKEKEKKDRGGASFLPFQTRVKSRAEIEEELRGGSSSSMASPESYSEVVDYSDEDKIIKKKRKLDGNNGRAQHSNKPNGGADPEPCHHGWVGALANMSASAPTWFCTKDLTRSDLDPRQNRLLLPKLNMEKFVDEFLTERERREVTRGGVKAAMVDEMGRCWETRLNLWASKSYNLNGKSWRRMVSRYELSEEYALKVGAFRYRASESDDDQEKSLGFVLLVQRKVCYYHWI